VQAFVTVKLKNYTKPIDKPTSPAHGLRLPYVTRDGVPVFTLDTDDKTTYLSDDFIYVDATPGMVGVTLQGQFYCIDQDENAQPLPIHLISERQYKRLLELEQSFKKERV